MFIRFILNWLWLHCLQIRCFCRRQELVTVALIEHLGDIVACEPVARHVRCTHPGACVLWCVCAPYRELIDNHPDVDKVMVVSCLTEWILLRKIGMPGQIVDLHLQGRCCQICYLPLTKPEDRSGLDVNNYYNFGGLLQAFCRSAGLSGLTSLAPQIYIPSTAASKVAGLKLPEPFIVFHARANQSERNWREEKWVELLKRIWTNFNLTTIEVGTSPLVLLTSPRYQNLCGRTSPTELAEVIRRAILFVGVDSGPAHIANAVQCPGIILLGRYFNFTSYFPYTGYFADGGAVVVRTPETLDALSVVEVFDAVAMKLTAIQATTGSVS